MDKEYLKKHNLLEAHKQFMRLSEGYLATSLAEAEDDENQPQDQQPMNDAQPPMDGSNGMPPADGQQPPMDNQQPPMDGPIGMPPADGQQPPMDNQQPPMDDMEPEEEDDVLDVEDLTQAQEKLNDKQNDLGHDLGQLDGRIESLLTAVEKMKGIIDHNNNEITSLKAELEKRIPTQTEKLKMQSIHTYPYNVGLDDYWKTHDGDGIYDVNGDNEQKKKVYTIKEKDLDDYTDSAIDKSLDDDDLNQTMEKIFRGFN